jgi:hypothetical protein
MVVDAFAAFLWYYENEYFQAYRNYIGNWVGGGCWCGNTLPVHQNLHLNQEVGAN